MRKKLALVSALLLVTTSALAKVNLSKKSFVDTTLKVTDVIDGDTFVTENRQRIRLFGANAPELNYCLGPESKSLLESLIKNKKILLAEPRADKWGRVLALVYQNNILVNLVMVQAGLARFEGETSSKETLFHQANNYARQNKLGVFSPTCYQTENPHNSNCNIKGNIDKGDGTKIYHLSDCSEYNRTVVETSLGEQWFCTESEAKKAGYTKSLHCPR